MKFFLLGLFLILVGIILVIVPAYVTSTLLLIIVVPHAWISALALLVGGPGIVFEAFRDLALSVELFPEGFAWRRLNRTSRCRWDDIKAVWNSGNHSHHGGMSYIWPVHYTVVLKDGRKITFGYHLRDACQLGRLIEEETCRRMLPKLLEDFYSEKTLDFGKVKVNSHGWTKEQYSIPWNEVSNIYVDGDGWFTIERKETPARLWISVSLNKIPNAQLLLRIVGEIGSVRNNAHIEYR